VYIDDKSVFGGYQCRATNMLGTMARIVYLEEASKPFSPIFKISVRVRERRRRRTETKTILFESYSCFEFVLPFQNVRGNSVIMTITNSPVTNKDKAVVETDGYVVQFAKPESDWSQSNEQQFQISRDQSYTLANLESNTEYKVRVAARTAAGPGDFSEAKTATTKKWVPTAATIGTSGSNRIFSSSCYQWVLTAVVAALRAVYTCV